MPTSIIQTKEDEKIWERAKEIAKSQDQENNYALILSIFEKIKKDIKENNSKELLFEWTEENNEEIFEELMQQVFPSPGGKYRVARRFVKWFPTHRTYVEPFAGGLACYFNKEPSEIEIINDFDQDIARAYKFVRDCSEDEITQLKSKQWESNKQYFHKLKNEDYSEKDMLEKFYKYMYLIKASYGGNRLSFGYKKINTHFIERIPQLKERLKNTKIYNENYLDVIKEYDNYDTFLYLDPPYPDEWPGPEQKGIKLWGRDEVEELVNFLKTCKSKFMVSLNNLRWIREMFEGNGWEVMTTPVPRTFRLGMKPKYELLVTNYKILNAEPGHLKKADDEINVNTEMKQLAEAIYTNNKTEKELEFLEVLLGSLDDFDLILKRKEEQKKYDLKELKEQKEFYEQNIIEKLPDGERILITKTNNKLKITNQKGKPHQLIQELKKEITTDPRDFVIEAYHINNDTKQTIFATDVYYLNEDLTNKNQIERKKYIKTMSFSSKFRMNPFVVIQNNQIEKASKLFSNSLYAKGSIIRKYDGNINELGVITK